ncbi:hypothetical protein H5410_041437, partial [Solanum commersonii]
MADHRMYRRSQLTLPKGPSQPIFKHYKYLFKFLARERGHKTKTTKLIAGGIGSTWVHLGRVNPSPSPTHSARESEWAKVEAVLKAATRCSRETESIR